MITEKAKEARALYMRKYREEHRAQLREYQRNYRKKHPEKLKEYNRRYNKIHRAELQKKRADYAAKYWEKKANEKD